MEARKEKIVKQEVVRDNNVQEKRGKNTSAKTHSRDLKENAFTTELRKHHVEDVCIVDIMNGIF